MNESRQRKFPGCDRGTLRPDRKAKRKSEAADRQDEFDALTDDEKFARTGNWKYA